MSPKKWYMLCRNKNNLYHFIGDICKIAKKLTIRDALQLFYKVFKGKVNFNLSGDTVGK